LEWLDKIDPTRPILLAGPTASGKSALALMLARRFDAVVINGDALQVYGCWSVLTARPQAADLGRAPHHLYGHVGCDAPYSVGHWLRDVGALLQIKDGKIPIIVGGTGLYFSSLVNGLADIPPTGQQVRDCADTRMQREGHQGMLGDLIRLDRRTVDRIDTNNPVRVQRAWEVLTATGRGLADWQDDTPPPLVALHRTNALLLDAPKDWLTPRIEARFGAMLAQGALEECRANLARWNPAHPSARAIGASELIAHLNGEMTLTEAARAATIASRQYAKRQRSWFRTRMKTWTHIDAAHIQP